jgi:hypothetical protein
MQEIALFCLGVMAGGLTCLLAHDARNRPKNGKPARKCRMCGRLFGGDGETRYCARCSKAACDWIIDRSNMIMEGDK